MTKSLKDFIGNVKDGLARNSHYSVFFNKPGVVASNLYENSTMERMLMFCEQTQLPGLNIATTQIRTYGEVRETPYERMFDPVNFNFYVDKEMKVKMFFDEWINGIQNSYTRTMNYYDDYTTNIEIIVYDVANYSRYKVTLYEAYPKAVNAIQLDYNNKDVMRLGVTMQYKYWRTNLMTNPVSSTASLASPINDGFSIPNSYFNSFSEFTASLQTSATNMENWWQNL